jgi:hypothetical protein
MQCVFMETHTPRAGAHKDEPLTDFLRRQSRAVVPMSFDEIERVIRSAGLLQLTKAQCHTAPGETGQSVSQWRSYREI